MKRAMLFLTMFIGIPTFCAQTQQNTSQSPITNWLPQVVSDTVRYYNKTMGNSDLYEKMLGCRGNNGCAEHEKTKEYVTQYRVSPQSQELLAHINTRRLASSDVTLRILSQTGYNEIGDRLSGHTIQNIKNVLEFCDVLSTPQETNNLVTRLQEIRDLFAKTAEDLEIYINTQNNGRSPASSTPTHSPAASVTLATSQPGEKKS